MLQTAPEIQIADWELRESRALLSQRLAEQGFKVLGSGGVAQVREVENESEIRSYHEANASLGLHYPLFGTRRREQAAVLEAETTVAADEHRRALAERAALLSLRRSYVQYWADQRRATLSKLVLEREQPVRAVLEQRTVAGLLLEPDRREFLSAFELARRNLATARANRDFHFATIRQITRPELAPFVAAYPGMPKPCLQEGPLLANVRNYHPESAALHARITGATQLLQAASGLPVESGVNLLHGISREYPGSRNGHNTSLNITFRMPLDYRAARRATRDRHSAVLAKARLELRLRTHELESEAQRVLHLYRAQQQSLVFTSTRLASMDERLRIDELRAKALAGDMLEHLQQAHIGYYNAALDTVEADAELLQTRARLLSLAPQGCTSREPEYTPSTPELRTAGVEPDPVAVEPEARPASNALPDAPTRLSVYVWQSDELLASAPSAFLWQDLADRHIQRLLLSLDGKQIRALRDPSQAARLARFVETARSHRIDIELLLGEPTWILPQHRVELLDILGSVQLGLFSGIHLDLEPNQLDEARLGSEYLLRELLLTLIAAKTTSPVPVGLSIHPRYLNMDVYGATFGERLQRMRLDEVAIMVYVANPNRVQEIVDPILARHPQLRVSIAQSIEDTLSADESHHRRGRAELQRTMADLQARFGQENFAGLILQSWSHFRYLTP